MISSSSYLSSPMTSSPSSSSSSKTHKCSGTTKQRCHDTCWCHLCNKLSAKSSPNRPSASNHNGQPPCFFLKWQGPNRRKVVLDSSKHSTLRATTRSLRSDKLPLRSNSKILLQIATVLINIAFFLIFSASSFELCVVIAACSTPSCPSRRVKLRNTSGYGLGGRAAAQPLC